MTLSSLGCDQRQLWCAWALLLMFFSSLMSTGALLGAPGQHLPSDAVP